MYLAEGGNSAPGVALPVGMRPQPIATPPAPGMPQLAPIHGTAYLQPGGTFTTMPAPVATWGGNPPRGDTGGRVPFPTPGWLNPRYIWGRRGVAWGRRWL